MFFKAYQDLVHAFRLWSEGDPAAVLGLAVAADALPLPLPAVVEALHKAFHQNPGLGYTEASTAVRDFAPDWVGQMVFEIAALGASSPKPGSFLGVEEILALPDPTWLLDGILVDGSLAVVYGPPGAGKTFVALDWALHVAAGRGWQGRATLPGLVVYSAGEGVAGIKRRLLAWTGGSREGLPARFRLAPALPRFMEPGQVQAFVRAIEGLEERPRLVVIDTIARALGAGDVNSNQDMARVVEGFDAIRKAIGCCVLGIHHTRKDQESYLGAVGLLGAVDTMIQLKPEGEGFTLSCPKQKDAEPFPAIDLALERVEWTGDDGYPVAGARVVRGEACPSAPQPVRKLARMILAKPAAGMSTAEIAREFSTDRSAGYSAIRLAQDQGVIYVENGYWKLTEAGKRIAKEVG